MMQKILCTLMAAALMGSGCNSGNSGRQATTADTTPAAAATQNALSADTVQHAGTAPANETVVKIRQALLTRLIKADTAFINAGDRKFMYTEYDLNDDGLKEIFVGFQGPYFCGNAGCRVLLLDPSANLISRFTIVQTPVAIARGKNRGWSDLIVTSRGVPYIVKWDGKKYPSNPSVQPRFRGKVDEAPASVLAGGQWYDF